MANQIGIAITIKAFILTGKTLDEQFKALSALKAAHESGDYSELLKLAKVDEVKAEQKTRRIEDQPEQTQADPAQTDIEDIVANTTVETVAEQNAVLTDAEVPAFLKNDKKDKAA